MTATISRLLVDSSSLKSIAYDENEAVLELEFHSGDVYRFSLVPAKTWNELRQAPSKGSFFNRVIRDRHTFIRVRPAASDDLAQDLRRSAMGKINLEPPDRPPK